MTPYISPLEEKKKKKANKEPKLKIGDKVTQNSSGIEGTVLDKVAKGKEYIPVKWDGGSQTTQHLQSIKKVEESTKNQELKMSNPLIKSISKAYGVLEEDVQKEWNQIKEGLSISDEKIGASMILTEIKKRYKERSEIVKDYISQFTEAKDIVKFNSEQKKKLLKYCVVKVGSLFHQAILKTGASPEQESKLLEEVIEKFIKEEPMEGFSMKKSEAKPEKEDKKKGKEEKIDDEPLSEDSFYKRVFTDF